MLHLKAAMDVLSIRTIPASATKNATLRTPDTSSTSQQTPNVEASPLLRLPRELRNAIYELATADLCSIVVRESGKISSRVALLQTCHQIQAEATDVILHRAACNNTVVVLAIHDLDFSIAIAYVESLNPKEQEQLVNKSTLAFLCSLSATGTADLTDNLITWLRFCCSKCMFMTANLFNFDHTEPYTFKGDIRSFPEASFATVKEIAKAMRDKSSFRTYQASRIVPEQEVTKITRAWKMQYEEQFYQRKWDALPESKKVNYYHLRRIARKKQTQALEALDKFMEAQEKVSLASREWRARKLKGLEKERSSPGLERRIMQDAKMVNDLSKAYETCKQNAHNAEVSMNEERTKVLGRGRSGPS